MFFAESLGLESLSPSGVLGAFILLAGIIFSLMMFYVGYLSISDMYSRETKYARDEKMKKQKEKIARLYPQ